MSHLPSRIRPSRRGCRYRTTENHDPHSTPRNYFDSPSANVPAFSRYTTPAPAKNAPYEFQPRASRTKSVNNSTVPPISYAEIPIPPLLSVPPFLLRTQYRPSFP